MGVGAWHTFQNKLMQCVTATRRAYLSSLYREEAFPLGAHEDGMAGGLSEPGRPLCLECWLWLHEEGGESVG